LLVDLRVPPCVPVAELTSFCVAAEQAGFSGVGLLDSQHYFRDTYVMMAQVLAATEHLRVHPAVTCPGPRIPSVIAGAAKTVQEFGPDRFELWLGRGGTANRSAGIPRTPLTEMRAALQELRTLLRPSLEERSAVGKPLRFGDQRPVRIFMATAGPMATRLAAELCDGVAFRSAPHPGAINEARGWIEEGAAQAGRDVADIEQWFQVRCLVRASREEAIRSWSPNLVPILAGPRVAEWLASNGPGIRISHRLALAIQRANAALQGLEPDARHPADWEAAVEISKVVPYEIQAALGDQLAILGSAEDVLHRLRDLGSLGLQRIYLHPSWTFQLPEPELAGFRDVIGPGLRSDPDTAGARHE
jgi:5,10-methylenetetrahydromethanopterin reductase